MRWVRELMDTLYPRDYVDWVALVWIVLAVAYVLWPKKGAQE